MRKLLSFIIALLCIHSAQSQDTELLTKNIDSLISSIETLKQKVEKKKLIRFGLSLGNRQAFSIKKADKFLAIASISPMDSTLQIELANRHTFLLSAVVSVFPFEKKSKSISGLGFYSNINLAELAGGEFESIFNKKVEGGLGVLYRFSEPFALALGYEFIFHRRLRNYLIDNYQGKQIIKDGTVLTSLDEDDNNLFREDNVHAWSLKFVYYF